jgi:hypothetical protein
MSLSPENVISFDLARSEFHSAITFVYHVSTHTVSEDDTLQYFIRILMGELAEQKVLQWLQAKGKTFGLIVDKGATKPDLSHEVRLSDVRGKQITARVHTFFSTGETDITKILKTNLFVLDANDLRGINIAVYFWIPEGHDGFGRLPSLQHAAIFGWASDKNFREAGVSQRQSVGKEYSIQLSNLRPLDELLQFLV